MHINEKEEEQGREMTPCTHSNDPVGYSIHPSIHPPARPTRRERERESNNSNACRIHYRSEPRIFSPFSNDKEEHSIHALGSDRIGSNRLETAANRTSIQTNRRTDVHKYVRPPVRPPLLLSSTQYKRVAYMRALDTARL